MKTLVSAIVITHDGADFFSRTLASLKNQPIDEVIVIDTALEFSGFNLAQAIRAGEERAAASSQWLWILHDDSAPLDGALQELLNVVERSPSVAVVGPKQVGWNDSHTIVQQGLTLTRTGSVFSLVSGELDQSQHDDAADVLGVGTAGMLVKREVWQQLGGLADGMTPLAADLDFSMRARLAGHRVVVAPHARVAHALLSLHGKRDRAWLGVQPKSALRRAELQLRFSYAPALALLLIWLFLPLSTLLRLVWRVWTKRPDRLVGDFAAGMWAYFTVFARLRYRRRPSAAGRRAMRALYATNQQVRDDKRRNIEREEIEARLEAHAALAEREDQITGTAPNTEQLLLGIGSTSKSFIASGGLWFVATLTALSFAWLPSGSALSGGGALPLNTNWFALFRRAGASFQQLGSGFAAPADPFVWVLTGFGSLTFWQPSLSLVLLIFLAKGIAFFGAFKAVSLFSKKSWVRNLAALSYALWPALTQAQIEFRIPALVAQLALPFLVFAIAKVALFGVELSVRSKQQTWSWVGLSGLLLSIEISAAPNSAPVIFLALIFVLIARIRRFGYLIWIALPVVASFGPLFVYSLLIGQPLAVLADPGVPQSTTALDYTFYLLVLVVPLLLAGLGLLTARRGVVLLTLGLGVISLLAAKVVAGLQFSALGAITVSADKVNGSPAALLAIATLSVACAIAVTLESIRRRPAMRLASTALIALFLLPAAAEVAIAAPEGNWGDAQVMPALIQAQAQSGSNDRTLVITSAVGGFIGSVVPVDGIQLEDSSVAYRFALPHLQNQDAAQLVAELVTGGGEHVQSLLGKFQIDYVLVPKSKSLNARDISSALDSVAQIEGAGETAFGKIWRVRDASVLTSNAQQSPWSITKALQLVIFAVFVLLAIPSRSARRQAGSAEIFIEAGEGND